MVLGTPTQGTAYSSESRAATPGRCRRAIRRRGGRGRFGYKAHVAVDEGGGIVRRATMTPADVRDSVPADDLVQGDEEAVYADKAYDSEARRAGLRERGIEPRIMYRARRNRPLIPAG